MVASPTYLADIRTFFRQEDVDHMALKGIDLGTYDGVKRNALRIFSHTAPPNPDMPPDPAGNAGSAPRPLPASGRRSRRAPTGSPPR